AAWTARTLSSYVEYLASRMPPLSRSRRRLARKCCRFIVPGHISFRPALGPSETAPWLVRNPSVDPVVAHEADGHIARRRWEDDRLPPCLALRRFRCRKFGGGELPSV